MSTSRISLVVVVLGLSYLAVSWLPRLLRRESAETPAVLEQRVANGTSTEERVRAADGLMRQAARARQEIRRSLATNQTAPAEVRIRLLQAAMQARDWRSMPEVFRAMQDPDVDVRGWGGAAARAIMGIDLYFRAADPPEKRAEAFQATKDVYQNMLTVYPEVYKDQEESQ